MLVPKAGARANPWLLLGEWRGMRILCRPLFGRYIMYVHRSYVEFKIADLTTYYQTDEIKLNRFVAPAVGIVVEVVVCIPVPAWPLHLVGVVW